MRRGFLRFLGSMAIALLFCLPVLAQEFTGEASVAFPPFTPEVTSIFESDQGVAGGITFYYLPLKQIVVGYRISLVEPSQPPSEAYWRRDPRYSYPVYFCDVPAQYVLSRDSRYYEQANPQSFTLRGLVPQATYYVVVTPLCIWPKSPWNIDERGKAFWYVWLPAKTFGWVYTDGSSSGLVMSEGEGGERKRGYAEVYRVVFEGAVLARKSSGGPGGRYSPQ